MSVDLASNPKGDISEFRRGAGWIAAWRRDERVIFGVLLEHDSRLDRRHTSVWRSDDAGRHWTSVPAPRGDVEGVVFPDDVRGFAWSRATLWSTVDGAATWKEIASGSFGSAVQPDAAVSAEGRLWLGGTRTDAARAVTVVRSVAPQDDGFDQVECELGIGSLDGLVAVGDAAYAALIDEPRGGLQLVAFRLVDGSCKKTAVLKLTEGYGRGLAGGDGGLALAVRLHSSTGTNTKIYVGAPDDSPWVAVSTPFELTGFDISTDGSLWALSSMSQVWRLDVRHVRVGTPGAAERE